MLISKGHPMRKVSCFAIALTIVAAMGCGSGGTVKTDDEARERFVELLDQLGQDDPRTNTYRRRLATALF